MTIADRLGANRARSVAYPHVAIAVFPMAVLVTGLVLRGIIAPIYAGLHLYDYDPVYVYLFNGAGLIEGYTPHHTDHPGTPVQILSGVVSYATWLVAGEGTFSAAIFGNPEFYIASVSTVLLVLNVLGSLYLGARIHAASGSIASALIAQSGLLLLGALAPHTFYLSPEAMQLFAATMAIAVLAPLLFGHESDTRWTRGVALGFFLALGVTSKVTFLPLVALVLLLPEARERLIAGAATVGFGAALLAFIAPMLGRTYNWLLGIAAHSGRYGTGEPGLVDLAKLPGNALTLVTNQPILVVAMLSCAAIVLGGGFRGRAALLAGVLLAVLLAQTAMVLKHFEIYYALPAIALSSTVIAWFVHRTFTARIALVVAGVMIMLAAAQTWSYAAGLKARALIRSAEIGRLNAELARHPSAIVVGAFRARTEKFARQFGLEHIDQEFARSLTGDRPNWLQYERWSKTIVEPGAEYDLTILNAYVRSGAEVLMVLPRDVDIAGLVGTTILDLPNAERIVRLERIETGARTAR